MPAATNKAALLAVTAAEAARLDALIAPLSDEIALRKRAGDTAIRDVIGHRAHWIDLFIGWQAAGARGETPAIPAPGYKWNQLVAYNADVRAAQAGTSWPATQAALVAAQGRLLQFIQTADDATLYGGPMPGGGNPWPTGRWAEAVGPSHYRSAAKWIRGVLRQDRASGSR